MLGQVRGSVGEVEERGGTYAGLAMPVREEGVENLEEVGGEGDDARERGVSVVGKTGCAGRVYSWEDSVMGWRAKDALSLSGKSVNEDGTSCFDSAQDFSVENRSTGSENATEACGEARTRAN